MGDADSQFEMETLVPQEGGQAAKAASKMKDPKHRDWLQDHENLLEALDHSDLESWAKLTEKVDALKEEVHFLKDSQQLFHTLLQGGG